LLPLSSFSFRKQQQPDNLSNPEGYCHQTTCIISLQPFVTTGILLQFIRCEECVYNLLCVRVSYVKPIFFKKPIHQPTLTCPCYKPAPRPNTLQYAHCRHYNNADNVIHKHERICYSAVNCHAVTALLLSVAVLHQLVGGLRSIHTHYRAYGPC